MKLLDVLILSLAAALVIIAVHQTITVGIGSSYWIVMLGLALFFLYNYRKRRD